VPVPVLLAPNPVLVWFVEPKEDPKFVLPKAPG
jgi:hypothetical protein